MITKERIDELIKNRAKIYGISKSGEVFCLGLKFRPETLKHKRWLKNKYEVYSKFFETKEDAEWDKEFGCIERTERLELPIWEEFDEQKFVWFVDKEQNVCCLHYVDFSNRIFINVSGEVIDFGEITKENYTLACRKAKELFLGQSNDN